MTIQEFLARYPEFYLKTPHRLCHPQTRYKIILDDKYDSVEKFIFVCARIVNMVDKQNYESYMSNQIRKFFRSISHEVYAAFWNVAIYSEGDK